MPNYTSNLNLEKPLQSENYNVDVFNTHQQLKPKTHQELSQFTHQEIREVVE